VPEVAERLGLHPESVRKMVRSGRLPAFKAGRSWRFDAEDLQAWLKKESNAAPGAEPASGGEPLTATDPAIDGNPATDGSSTTDADPATVGNPAADGEPPRGPALASGASGCDVLIVDDEEGVCRMLARLLERFGCRSRAELDGAAGLEQVAREVPDLLLLDLVMPGMKGPEFLARLREDHPDLPVVIVTAFPDSDLMSRAMAFAPVMILAKPVSPALLHRTLRAVLGGRVLPLQAGP
jgi:excisionase family DNA binding protein